MLDFNSSYREVAVKLIAAHRTAGVEHYWAEDSAGRVYQKVGCATVVYADPDLEKRYDELDANVVYHHSHPDERALSPSDLELIGRVGVKQIWAHSPQGAAYGAELKEGICKHAYLQALQSLGGFILPELIKYPQGNCLTIDQFEKLRDIAIMTALERRGWIFIHAQLSDAIRRTICDAPFGYLQLVQFLLIKSPTP